MKVKELPFSIYHSIRLRYGSTPMASNICPVVVSLTSIPSRLSTLDIVISSLLAQSYQPQLIVLWLNKVVKNDLPGRLTELEESDRFEIRYCEGTRSYRKLLPSLKAFPDTVIVTCDDDLIYPDGWLAGLYRGHKQYPEKVVSQVGRLISRTEDGNLKPYKQWSFIRTKCTDDNFLPIGYGGVLYPAGAFSKEVFNKKKYETLSANADDLWFKAMAYLNGNGSCCISEIARPIPIIRTQKVSLGERNIGKDANRSQWHALCEHYPSLTSLG